jgi:hypothetical protein
MEVNRVVIAKLDEIMPDNFTPKYPSHLDQVVSAPPALNDELQQLYDLSPADIIHSIGMVFSAALIKPNSRCWGTPGRKSSEKSGSLTSLRQRAN